MPFAARSGDCSHSDLWRSQCHCRHAQSVRSDTCNAGSWCLAGSGRRCGSLRRAQGLFPDRSAQYQTAYDDFVASILAGDRQNTGLSSRRRSCRCHCDFARKRRSFYNHRLHRRDRRRQLSRGKSIGTNSSFVKPFALTSTSQFRAPPPPSLDSAAYALDANEVMAWGGTTSNLRSAEQLEAARFHTEAPPTCNRETIAPLRWIAAASLTMRARWQCCGLRRQTQVMHASKPSTSMIFGGRRVRSDSPTRTAMRRPRWMPPGRPLCQRQTILNIHQPICAPTVRAGGVEGGLWN